MPFEFGDVVLVRFPFTSQAAFKQRPAVVVSNRDYNMVRPDVGKAREGRLGMSPFHSSFSRFRFSSRLLSSGLETERML